MSKEQKKNCELAFMRSLSGVPPAQRLAEMERALSTCAWEDPQNEDDGEVALKSAELTKRYCWISCPPVEIGGKEDAVRFFQLLLREKNVQRIDNKLAQQLLQVAPRMSTHSTKLVDTSTKTALYIADTAQEDEALPYYGCCNNGLGTYIGNAGEAFAGRLLGAKVIVDNQIMTVLEAVAADTTSIVSALSDLGADDVIDELKLLAATQMKLRKRPVEGDAPCLLFPTDQPENYVALSPVPNYRDSADLAAVNRHAPEGRRVHTLQYAVGGANPINAGVAIVEQGGWVTSLLARLPWQAATDLSRIMARAKRRTPTSLLSKAFFFSKHGKQASLFTLLPLEANAEVVKRTAAQYLLPALPRCFQDMDAAIACMETREDGSSAFPLELETLPLAEPERRLLDSLAFGNPIGQFSPQAMRDIVAHVRRRVAGEPIFEKDDKTEHLAKGQETALAAIETIIHEWLLRREAGQC